MCTGAGLSVAALPGRVSMSAPAKKPMNIILIMADDIAHDNFSCYGSDYFKTPRLDALARTGAQFKHCYSEPVCTPSRVKIMTGRDNIRNYVRFGLLDRKETTFGTVMKQAGYATAVAGKWQLQGNKDKADGSLAPDCGFDTFCLWNYPGTAKPRYWKPSLIRDGQLVPVTEDSHGKFIEVKDRYEKTNILPGTGSPDAESARGKLRAAIDSMPQKE